MGNRWENTVYILWRMEHVTRGREGNLSEREDGTADCANLNPAIEKAVDQAENAEKKLGLHSEAKVEHWLTTYRKHREKQREMRKITSNMHVFGN